MKPNGVNAWRYRFKLSDKESVFAIGDYPAIRHADYLSDRAAMMQQWADYLDTLKTGAQVIPLRANSAAR